VNHHPSYKKQFNFKRSKYKKSLRDHKRGEREIFAYAINSEGGPLILEVDNDCKCAEPEYYLSKDENCLVCKYCFGLAKTGGTNGNHD
jgi:hypothetical protein